MDFIEAAKKNAGFTRTENGAVALNTTSDARLDLFGTIGSLREAPDGRVEYLFNEAFREDPLFATKIAFYARDVRGGLGERRVFRVVLKNLATTGIKLFAFFKYGLEYFSLSPSHVTIWYISYSSMISLVSERELKSRLLFSFSIASS